MEEGREPELRLTQRDAGGRRIARAGDLVEVRLPENRTTGYRWHVDVDPTVLRLAGDEFAADPVSRGATGVRTLTFEVRCPGHARLRLVKRRPWECESHEAYGVDLKVEP
jgi:inhibitor of cysteine peptidase